MNTEIEPLPEGTVVIPTGVPVELINHYRTVMRWRNRVIGFALAMLVLGIVCFAIVINHQTALGREILAQSKENGDLLAKRNAELRKQVDQSRDLLTQLYAALNISQKQVIALGGVPEHFEFSVPTTTSTTTPPVAGSGSVTTTGTVAGTSGNAAGNVTVGQDSSLVLGMVFTPMLVPLLVPTTVEVLPEPPPPTVEVTIPPVTVPVPDTVPVTVPPLPPPLGFG